MDLMEFYTRVTRIEKILKSIQHEIVKLYIKLSDNGESSGIEEQVKYIEDYLHQVKDKIASGQFTIDHHDQLHVGLTSDKLNFYENSMDFDTEDTTTTTCDGLIDDEIKPEVHLISSDKLVEECLNKKSSVLLERLPNLTPTVSRSVSSEQNQDNLQLKLNRKKFRMRKFFKCDFDNCKKMIQGFELQFHKYTHSIPDFDFYWDQLTCPVCRKTFINQRGLKNHILKMHHPKSSHIRYNCSLCNKSYATRGGIRDHEKSHSKIYHCPKLNCSMTFRLEGTFKLHLQRRHGNIKCTVENCDYHFTTQTSLDTHMENFHGEKVVCPICSKLYTRSRLRIHNWQEHREFKCTFEGCSEVFTKEPLFKQHQAEHDPEIKPEFLCTVCGSGYWTKYCLGSHFRSFHRNQLNCSYEGCTRIFSRQYNLSEHIKTHKKRIIAKNKNKL